jgi:ABC-type uncharacterized transport system permease subunit
LFKTKFGLRLRSAGENPWAAESLGVNVRKYKVYGIMISGFLSALAGMWLASNQNSYSDGMIAGRGYIALAAMIIGKWKPVNIFFACLMFSAFEALGDLAAGIRYRHTSTTDSNAPLLDNSTCTYWIYR